MNLFTLAGALIVAGCGIEGARRLDLAAERDVALIDAYISLFRYVRLQVDCFAKPISEILADCDAQRLEACGLESAHKIKDLCEIAACCRVRDKDALSVILSFCSEFGGSYLEEQLKRCDVSIALLEKRRQELANELPTRKKLYATLCVSAALALIILLI